MSPKSPRPPVTTPDAPSTEHSPGWDPRRVAKPDSAAELDARFKPGASIGRYQIIERIGAGGMGVVFLALDPALDRRLALKLMRPEALSGSNTSEGRARFMREAHAMAKLNHPNVVGIFDVGEFDQQVFLAMNLIDGMSAREWLEAKPRSWREILTVFIEAGRGLEAAHAVGLIHRDFKPDNVLIDAQGHAHVTDFGLARAANAATEADLEETVTSTSESSGDALLSQPITHGISGTPGYMSPEQAMGKLADARTDQYSFCVSLAEALYGPHDGKLEWAPVRDPAMVAAVPNWLRAAVAKGMSEEAKDRYPDMTALLLALGKDPAVRRRRLAIAGLVVSLVAIIAGLGTYVWKKRQADICFAPERRFAGMWDDAARQNLRRAFVATGAPKAAETAEQTVRRFDDAQANWLTGYRSACAATRERNEQPEAALSLRVACLERQLYDFRGALELLAKPDQGLVSSAVAVASSLPAVSECGNAFSLSLVEPPPPQLASVVQAFRIRLARARALVSAWRWAEATDILAPIASEALDAGYGPITAEAFFTLATTQVNGGAHQAAVENYREALDVAEGSRMDDLAARAAARLVWQMATNGASAEALSEALRRARVLQQRVGTAGFPALDLELALEAVGQIRGVSKEEVTHGHNALELSEKLYGSDSPKLLPPLNNYALDLVDDGEYDQALAIYQRAIALSDRLFGPDAPSSGHQWAVDGLILARLGRESEALGAAQHALRALTGARENADLALGLAVESFALASLGSLKQARTVLHQVIAVGERLKASTSPDFDEVNLFIAESALLADDPAIAVEAYEHNLVADKEFGAASPAWVGDLRVGGAAYLAVKKPGKARELLERGLSLASGHIFYPSWVPSMRYRLAQALILTGGDRARAEELAAEARDDLEKQPEQKALLAEVNAWARATFAPGAVVTPRGR